MRTTSLILLVAILVFGAGCEMFQPIADGAARGAATEVVETPEGEAIDPSAVGDAAVTGAEDAATEQAAQGNPAALLILSLLGFLRGRKGDDS